MIIGSLVERISRDFWSGLLAASLLSFSPLTWRYAVVTEVFGLNHCRIQRLPMTARVSYMEVE